MLNNVVALYAGGAPVSTTSYESIATVTVGAGTTSAAITFSSIPQTYTHLQIRGMMTVTSGNNPAFQVGNGSIDTGANYSWHHLYGNAGAYSNGASSTTQLTFSYVPYPSYPGSFVLDIFNYANTNKFKTTRTLTGSNSNGSVSEVALWSGLWQSTSAINTIKFTPAAGSWDQYSHFALYGIK